MSQRRPCCSLLAFALNQLPTQKRNLCESFFAIFAGALRVKIESFRNPHFPLARPKVNRFCGIAEFLLRV
jgi:prolipoprotein diacylglyceryltransferase